MLLGQAQDSPLLVTVAAGAAALPTLLKLAAVISDQVPAAASSLLLLLTQHALVLSSVHVLAQPHAHFRPLALPAHCPPQPGADLAGAAEQLPVELPLGREFVFHSIFACPVSRDQVGASAGCSRNGFVCLGGRAGRQAGQAGGRAGGQPGTGEALNILLVAPLPTPSHLLLALLWRAACCRARPTTRPWCCPAATASAS